MGGSGSSCFELHRGYTDSHLGRRKELKRWLSMGACQPWLRRPATLPGWALLGLWIPCMDIWVATILLN